MEKELILLKYQDNFADNISLLAYKSILEKECGNKCYFENNTQKRDIFERKMSNFSVDYNFISTAKVQKLIENPHKQNKLYISRKEISKKRKIKQGIVDLKHFQIEDTNLLDDEFLNKIKFNNTDFIKSHDILEDILTSNSIGLYLNKQDIESNKVDYEFIQKATKRLNKYIKKPFLYVFSEIDIKHKINTCVNYKVITLSDWKEEFYFLKSCKHKIVPNLEKSYSHNYWATLLNQKSYHYCVYDKTLKQKTKLKNWIEV